MSKRIENFVKKFHELFAKRPEMVYDKNAVIFRHLQTESFSGSFSEMKEKILPEKTTCMEVYTASEAIDKSGIVILTIQGIIKAKEGDSYYCQILFINTKGMVIKDTLSIYDKNKTTKPLFVTTM